MTAWIKESDFLRRRDTGLLCFIVNAMIISAETHKNKGSCATGIKKQCRYGTHPNLSSDYYAGNNRTTRFVSDHLRLEVRS